MPDAYYKLGQTFERLNQIDNAKTAYETAGAEVPGQPVSHANQALDG